MDIPLNLKKHCIGTEIRRLYNQSLSQYFMPGADRQMLETKIEMLKTALEQSDFARLRTEYPLLSGGNDAAVCLSKDGCRPAFFINGVKVMG